MLAQTVELPLREIAPPLAPPPQQWGRGIWEMAVLAGGYAARQHREKGMGPGDGAAPEKRQRAQECRNLSAAEPCDRGEEEPLLGVGLSA